jgi:hypothetical protein
VLMVTREQVAGGSRSRSDKETDWRGFVSDGAGRITNKLTMKN